MAISSTQQTEILKVVAGLFNAAPGGVYLSELAGLVEGGMTTSQLADALAASPVFTTGVLAGKVTVDDQVDLLMKNFGVTADSDPKSAGSQAKAYFSEQLNDDVGLGQIVYDAVTFLSQEPSTLPIEFGPASVLLNNKVMVAAAFSKVSTSTDLDVLQNILGNVKGDVPYSDKDVTDILKGSGFDGAVGKTFTLTTGLDIPSSTGGNDTYVATDTTYTTGDQINGGSGTDQLSLTLGVANTAIVTLNSVENVKISDFSGNTVNGSLWTGVTGIEFANSTAATTVNNLIAIPSVTLTKTTNDVTVAMTAAAVAGTADAATVNFNGLTDNTKTFTMNGVETLTLNATGADSKVQVADTGLKTVIVTGDKKLNVSAAALPTTITSVDASAKTAGGFLANLAGSTLTSVKGGAGDDTILLGATAVGATVIDGGAGTDTLGLNNANVAGFLATTTKVTNVETLKVQGPVTAGAGTTTWDMSKVVGLANLTFDAAATVDQGTGKLLVVDNMLTGSTLRFDADLVNTGGTAAGLTVNVLNAGNAGTNDTITLVAAHGATAATADAIAAFTMANVENAIVDVKSVTGATSTITGIADAQLATLTFKSSAVDSLGNAVDAADLTTGAGFTSTVINKLDVSGYRAAATGVVDVSSLSGSLISTGATITGPSKGILVATGGVGADLITTGAGGSNSGTGLTGGLGADTYDLSASTAKTDKISIAAGNSASTGMDQVKGFTTSATSTIADNLNILSAVVAANVASGTVTSVTNLTGQISSGIITFGGTAASTATLTQLIQGAEDLIGANAKTAAFVYNGDTYVVDNQDASATVSANDIVVKLVGLTDATSVATTAGAHAILIS